VHRVKPVPQEHCPLTQLACCGQELLQLPQLRLSEEVSVQVLLHIVWPVAQPVSHFPLRQEWPGWQRLPQLPQFAGSLITSMQAALHCVVPVPQTHAPPVQLAPVPQWVPQAPQS
jgi:hypothetical protein